MFRFPPEFSEIISEFSPLFSKKVFERAGQLLLGTILTSGKRTVCRVLRTLGLQNIKNWDLYHRVLSRAKWSPLKCAHRLLGILIKHFVNTTTLVFGLDETLERRRGRNFLSVLAPSQRYHQKQGKQHKTLSDWARQICLLLYRWLPDFELIILGDGSYSIMELLASTRNYVTWITRFRLDAALYDFPPPYRNGQLGRPPIKGKRLDSLQQRLDDPNTKWKQVRFSKWYEEENKLMEITSGIALWYRGGKPVVTLKWILVRDPKGKHDPVAIQCTDLSLDPIQIVEHYLKRWQVEVTFEEVRAHLGVETQRQWSDLAILRTTPVLMALFSIITIWANHLNDKHLLTAFQTAWYYKPHPTFSDAVAAVRYRIWHFQLSLHFAKYHDSKESNFNFINHLAFMAARAA